MADGFIVRRGGKAEEVLRTATPDINFVSKTSSEIVVTFKNNDAGEAEIYYGLTAPLTDTVTLATGATSSNITFSGLDDDTEFTVSAYALVTDPTTKKIKSEIVSTNITTDAPVFTAATGGTTEEYDDGGKRYKSHTFTSDGDFIVTTVGDNIDDRNKVDYLIIAGGASGAGFFHGGGGGAGGYRTTNGTSGAGSTARTKITVTAQTYGIVVGAGGSGVSTNVRGNSGTASSGLAVSTVGGGSGGVTESPKGGVSGGSGGGASREGSVGTGTSDEGRNGGSGSTNSGGGGGGANTVGSNASGNNGGAGGSGLGNILRTGSSENRAGGGGGGGNSNGGTGGTGGGGNGASDSVSATNATTNTGSGGGGCNASSQTSGNGAAGIVVIRYEIAPSV